MNDAETPLEQAARHVREGETRLAAQKALARRLERGGPSQELADAQEALAQLLDFQVLANERLQQELARARSGGALGRGADRPGSSAVDEA